jgi:hypothetical protein
MSHHGLSHIGRRRLNGSEPDCDVRLRDCGRAAESTGGRVDVPAKGIPYFKPSREFAFGSEGNRGQIGGEKADNLVVSNRRPLTGPPVQSDLP